MEVRQDSHAEGLTIHLTWREVSPLVMALDHWIRDYDASSWLADRFNIGSDDLAIAERLWRALVSAAA